MAMAFAAAATATVGLPSGDAFAIDHVQCDGGRNDFLKIWSHLDGRDSVDCYANGGGPTSVAGGSTGSPRATTT